MYPAKNQFRERQQLRRLDPRRPVAQSIATPRFAGAASLRQQGSLGQGPPKGHVVPWAPARRGPDATNRCVEIAGHGELNPAAILTAGEPCWVGTLPQQLRQ